MRVVPTDVPMLKAVHSLELPEAGNTAWGVQIMDTERFRQVTDRPPTGYRGLDGIRPLVVVEWLDDVTGGVACMLKDPAEEDERYNRLPHAVNGGMVDTPYDKYNKRGMIPGCYDKTWLRYPATNLGFLVLTNTPDLIAVQYPGTDDYATAYRHVNDNKEPGILPNSRAYYPRGRKFLNIIARGLWPRDHHFIIAHGPAFVVGGSALTDEMRVLARNVPDEEVDHRGGFLDYYGNTGQFRAAKKRIGKYQKTGDPAALFEMDYRDLDIYDETIPEGHKPNVEILTRFNAFVATKLLDVVLPASGN